MRDSLRLTLLLILFDYQTPHVPASSVSQNYATARIRVQKPGQNIAHRGPLGPFAFDSGFFDFDFAVVFEDVFALDGGCSGRVAAGVAGCSSDITFCSSSEALIFCMQRSFGGSSRSRIATKNAY